MTTWGISRLASRHQRWLFAAGAFLTPFLLLGAVLAYPPTASWLRSLERSPLHGQDVSSQGWNASFSLLDSSGRRRTVSDYSGKIVLLAFGYTHCPDACPTTLARLAKVRQLLGGNAGKLQVLFVTIDPERDSAQLLDTYVRNFDPTFIALRGSESETDAATGAFHAEYQILQHGQDILVEHTVDTYLIGPQGRVRVVLPFDASAEDVAQDVHSAMRDTGL